MHDAVPLIKKQQDEARVKAENGGSSGNWMRKDIGKGRERIRRENEAYNASVAELKAIMAQWAEDKSIEQFFHEAESDSSLLEEKQKGPVMECL